jgi:exosome complex exonuclease DIS3/RRP44
LEGLVTFKKQVKFDAETYSITVPNPNPSKGLEDVTISVFDKVRVKIVVEQDRNTLRGKVKMILASPIDSTDL